MSLWVPDPVWQGQEAILIGGGTSLSGFDFEKLRGRNVVGINDAFRLGRDIVKFCMFGDASWFTKNQDMLVNWGGPVCCVASALAHLRLPYLRHMERERMGLHKDGKCGWNFSTGGAAVNFALYLGATRIFLLGYDMCSHRQTKKDHWHPYNDNSVKEYSYRRFLSGFAAIHSDLVKFPGVKIFNVTDGSSQLPYFPRIDFEAFHNKYMPTLQPEQELVAA